MLLKSHTNENGTISSEAIEAQESTNLRRLKYYVDALRNENKISSTDIQNLKAIVITIESEFIRKTI